MASKVFVLPGLLGSRLTRKAPLSGLVWVDTGVLARGGLWELNLKRDQGRDPASGAFEMEGAGPLVDYYDRPCQRLEEQLRKTQWRVDYWRGFDWRMRVQEAAYVYYSMIESEVSDTSPCILLGHSQGGLIARFVYALFVSNGRADQVEKVICVGTPHQGLYNPVTLWCAQNRTSMFLSLATCLTNLGTPGVNRRMTMADVINVSTSWPSLYEVLPHLGGTAAAEDSHRGFLYQADWYPDGVVVSQKILDEARKSLIPQMHASNTIPPAGKLHCIAGKGYPTITGLKPQTADGKPNYNFYLTDDGDDSVTVKSALLQGAVCHVVYGSHVGLLDNCITSGLIAKIIQTLTAVPTSSPDAPIIQPTPQRYYKDGLPPVKKPNFQSTGRPRKKTV